MSAIALLGDHVATEPGSVGFEIIRPGAFQWQIIFFTVWAAGLVRLLSQGKRKLGYERCSTAHGLQP